VRILTIINPWARGGTMGVAGLCHELLMRDVELTLRYMNGTASMEHLLRDAREHDAVIAAGGDGTVTTIAYALRATGIPIVVYPGGTANLVSLNLGLPISPAAIAAMVFEGVTTTVDLGEIELPAAAGEEPARYGFTLGAGTGFPAALLESARPLKKALGESAYVLGALRNLLPPVARFTLELDGETIETEGIAVMVMNISGIQYKLKIAHGSSPTDGLLEVITLKTMTAVELLPTVWAAIRDTLQDYPDRPGIEVRQARSVRITSDPPLDLEYDGEVLPGVTPVTVRVLPDAATFMVTQESLEALTAK